MEEELADCNMNRGVVLEALERPEGALAAYDDAFSVYRDLNLATRTGVCRLNGGIILESMKRYREAFDAYSEARALFLAVADQQGVQEAERALQRLEVYDS
jgi:tetratricopeptide (TPR) repeat protein